MSIDTCAEVVAGDIAGDHPMLIGSEWRPAASGEVLSVEDPATARRIATIPAGAAEDVDRAAACRTASVPVAPVRSAGDILDDPQ